MITIPPRTMIDRDEANGLNRIMIPTIKSMIPNSRIKPQFETPFLTAIATLIILILDKIIQIPSAIPNTVDKMPGMATSKMPTIIDRMPDIMP